MAAGTRRSGTYPRGARDRGAGNDRGRGQGHDRGHGHSHGGPAVPATTKLRVVIAALLVPFAVAAIVGMVLLWPASTHAAKPLNTQGLTYVQGTVTATQAVACGTGTAAGAGAGTGGGTAQSAGGTAAGTGAAATTDNSCVQVFIKITSGPTVGATVTQMVGHDPATPKYSPGDGVTLAYSPTATAESQYSLYDFQRGPPLASLAIVFAIFVVVVGRWRGVSAIAALVVSFVVLVKFTLPAILNGENSVEVAAVTAAVILFLALFSTHGLSVRTSVAVLGSALSLILIAALGSVAIQLAHITGLGSEEAGSVAGLFHQVDVRGLLLAGVIIGALGVLDDVTITQVSSVWELKHADPAMGVADLYRAGMRIGRDHIGSAVNTLVLAYAGAALPLLILASTSGQSWGGVASSEQVVEEVVRALIGSIGLVAAVPLTTALAAAIASSDAAGLHARASRRHTLPPPVPAPYPTPAYIPRDDDTVIRSTRRAVPRPGPPRSTWSDDY